MANASREDRFLFPGGKCPKIDGGDHHTPLRTLSLELYTATGRTNTVKEGGVLTGPSVLSGPSPWTQPRALGPG